LLGIIERASGRKLLDYAREKLFDPLGMDSVQWMTTADGLPTGGFGIDMTPHDMMRFGYLYLNNGNWDGQQVIPESYIASTPPPKSSDSYYGHWSHIWIPGAYQSGGANGQKIIVIPKYDLVVVITADVWEFIRDVGKFFWPWGR